MASTALPVENPAVRRIAGALGLAVTTDQAGKDGAETDTGIVIESRYFVGDVLITRERGTDVLGFGSRDWFVNGEKFGGPSEAFGAVAHMLRTRNRLPVESPAVRRNAAELGIEVTTDAQGKADGEANREARGGVMIESRYFVGDVLVEYRVASGVQSRQFVYTVDGEEYTICWRALQAAANLAARR